MDYRVRVRMYRHGLGDCFLLTFRKRNNEPFNILIDCGALGRDKQKMTALATRIRDDVKIDGNGKARLDVVVGTHEHKDHIYGFNQARDTFSNDFDFGSVWLAWTENLSQPQVRKIKETKKKALSTLLDILRSPLAGAAPERFSGVRALLQFSSEEDETGTRLVADAVEYLKQRGKDCGDLRYLEPGQVFPLGDAEGVNVYVLGPPRDASFMKISAVTEQMKRENIIYHLSQIGEVGIDALAAAIANIGDAANERFHPFAEEHRIAWKPGDPEGTKSRYFPDIEEFVNDTYLDAQHEWRRVDHDWLSAVDQLALHLDNDTNNTSLVLAFELDTGEVLLFPADAQVGNWLSWGEVEFRAQGKPKPVRALELLGKTAFYKVGHHCSHNATLKNGGLELMTRDDLVAFIPLDINTAENQGTKGWEMPAPSLYKELKKKAANRVVISDVNEKVPEEAKQAGVVETAEYIDYFVK